MKDKGTFGELYGFLTALSRNLSLAIRHNELVPDWLNSQDGNRGSRLHSQVWGILAKTGFDLHYVVQINAGYRPDQGKQFHPDIQLWRKKKEDSLALLIEYESTNSSDSRILYKDMANYVRSKKSKVFPDYWLIIHTLPDVPAPRWKSWDRPDAATLQRIRASPRQYYQDAFVDPLSYFGKPLPDISSHTDNNLDWEDRKILLLNLSAQGLAIDYPTTMRRTYRFAVDSNSR